MTISNLHNSEQCKESNQDFSSKYQSTISNLALIFFHYLTVNKSIAIRINNTKTINLIGCEIDNESGRC